MKSLLTNASLRRELVRKGLERAARFTWARTAEETLRVYQKALGNP